MERINSPWLATIAISAFIAIAYVSTGITHEETSYSKKQVEAINRLIAKRPSHKETASIIQNVWNLTDEDITKPVDIFGEKHN